jgi:glycosyltransferase involved in cell wall biosynthesis
MIGDHLRDLAGEHADRVHILGHRPDSEWFSIMAAADVIAIPSFWESFCIAALEAMALGRPVIGTTGNGFSEFIEDGRNGLLVERGDAAALARALSALLGDAELRGRLGAAAHDTAPRFDVAQVAPRFADALAAAARGSA